MRVKRWLRLGIIGVAFACILWIFLSLRNDDSTLSVVVRYVREEMGWSDSSSVGVFERMSKYEKKGHYDDAISIGLAWAAKHPDNFTSGWIYQDISTLYLKQAEADRGHSEQFLGNAILYRDKALAFASESPYSLQPLETISECVGDLSLHQRCVQYKNALKILDRMNLLVNEDKDRLARQFKPDPQERKRIACLSDWIDAAVARVRAKLPASGCQ